MNVDITAEQAQALRDLAAAVPGADPGVLEALDAALAAPPRKNPDWHPVEVLGTTAVMHNPKDRLTPYAAVDGYDPATNEWGAGSYRKDLLSAWQRAHGGHLIDVGSPDVVGWCVFTDEDVEDELRERGIEPDEGLLGAVRSALGDDVNDRMCEVGWERLREAVDEAADGLDADGGEGLGEEEDEALDEAPVEAPEAPAPARQDARARQLFSADYWQDLSDEEASEALGLDGVEPAEDHWDALMDLAAQDLDDVACDLDELWDAGDVLVARGASRRWDGVSEGFAGPYRDMAALLADTGRGGVFQDCEITGVWDEGGELLVRGVHHDGAVTVAVRPMRDYVAEGLMLAMARDVPVRVRAIWDKTPPARAWVRLTGQPPTAQPHGEPLPAAGLEEPRLPEDEAAAMDKMLEGEAGARL